MPETSPPIVTAMAADTAAMSSERFSIAGAAGAGGTTTGAGDAAGCDGVAALSRSFAASAIAIGR